VTDPARALRSRAQQVPAIIFNELPAVNGSALRTHAMFRPAADSVLQSGTSRIALSSAAT